MPRPPDYRYGADVENHPTPRGLPEQRVYAVGRSWVTKIKAPRQPGEKRKFRTLNKLRSDEAKAAEELKAMRVAKRTATRKQDAAKKVLVKALPDAGCVQDEGHHPPE